MSDETPTADDDVRFLKEAYEEARQAAAEGEVPVGAVVVVDGKIVAFGHNRRESETDPLAHAEVIAIREASQALGRWRLTGATLYVTLEPCVMCAGACVLARVDRVVYGAEDPKAGAVKSRMRLFESDAVNHRPIVREGVMAEECGELLRAFFRERRSKN